jgi:hypothetical protein
MIRKNPHTLLGRMVHGHMPQSIERDDLLAELLDDIGLGNRHRDLKTKYFSIHTKINSVKFYLCCKDCPEDLPDEGNTGLGWHGYIFVGITKSIYYVVYLVHEEP